MPKFGELQKFAFISAIGTYASGIGAVARCQAGSSSLTPNGAIFLGDEMKENGQREDSYFPDLFTKELITEIKEGRKLDPGFDNLFGVARHHHDIEDTDEAKSCAIMIRQTASFVSKVLFHAERIGNLELNDGDMRTLSSISEIIGEGGGLLIEWINRLQSKEPNTYISDQVIR